jgi:hypothetical protein
MYLLDIFHFRFLIMTEASPALSLGYVRYGGPTQHPREFLHPLLSAVSSRMAVCGPTSFTLLFHKIVPVSVSGYLGKMCLAKNLVPS